MGLLSWLTATSMAVPLSAALSAGEVGVRGYWQEPSGAVIQVADCTAGLCLKIVALPASDQPLTDVHNPLEKLRGRSLCGLRIGEGFMLTDPQHAQGGHLYDPRSGRTYGGSLSAQGNTLRLRGYLLLSMLGRTELWTRVARERATCTAG